MNATAILIIVIVIIVVVAITLLVMRRRKTNTLKEQFGPEYDRAVEQQGSWRKAEPELAARKDRVQSFDLRDLSSEDQTRYGQSWRDVQALFVDDPARAVLDADRLVQEVMRARGYPMADFEQRAADISVDHPGVVEDYRAAHDIAVKQLNGQADTEDLRQALVHYRSLFQDLLGTSDTPAATPLQGKQGRT